MRKKKKNDLLTEVELEFMNALWALGKGGVRDVLARLARILDEKGFVQSTKSGKALTYTPVLAKDAYQTRSLQDLSAKLFDNTPASLVARLVDDGGLSQEHLEEIRTLLDRRLANDPD